MLTHFQCDLCHFLNMNGRDPSKGSDKDERLIISIRRASLDAFWSIETVTVRGDLNMLRKMVTMDREELGLEYFFPPLVP